MHTSFSSEGRDTPAHGAAADDRYIADVGSQGGIALGEGFPQVEHTDEIFGDIGDRHLSEKPVLIREPLRHPVV